MRNMRNMCFSHQYNRAAIEADKNETENAHGKNRTLIRYAARSAARQTPGEIVGRLISLSLGLFMVLGTCTLL